MIGFYLSTLLLQRLVHWAFDVKATCSISGRTNLRHELFLIGSGLGVPGSELIVFKDYLVRLFYKLRAYIYYKKLQLAF